MKDDRTLAELASEFGVHASQIAAWRRELKDSAVPVFEGKRKLLTDELADKAKKPLHKEVEWLSAGWQVVPYPGPGVPF